jgi:hypothetical protein
MKTKNKKAIKKFIPKYLQLWTRPDSYAGSQYPDYYRTGFGQSRDSELMERCNFSAALDKLDAYPPITNDDMRDNEANTAHSKAVSND